MYAQRNIWRSDVLLCHAGKNGDVAFGQPQRDILEVVLAGATNLDIFLNHADICSLRIF